MALIPRLAGLVLASALVASCNQSLFDFPGDDRDGGGNGAADARVRDDGGAPVDDGGNVIPPDARIPPDASVPVGCPAPCVADAVAEFDDLQGGTTGSWLYAEDMGGPLGLEYRELLREERGATTVWAAISTPSPAIVHCPSSPDYPGCEGVKDKLLFETTEPGASHPALMWSVPDATPGVYRVSGDWRVPPGAPVGASMSLLLVRNSRLDIVREERFSTTPLPAAFDFEIDVLPGDFLRLIAISGDSMRAPLALSFYVSGASNAGRCQRATQFVGETSGGPTFQDLCGDSAFLDNATTNTQPPGNIPGSARAFAGSSYMEYLGSPNRYAGDWTVQFWAYLEPGGSDYETMLDDGDCLTSKGIDIYRIHLNETESSEVFVDLYHEEPSPDRCFREPAKITTSVAEGEWHFFRLTRVMDANIIRLCIDGQYSGNALVPGDADMSSTHPMQLGRDISDSFFFRGRLADLRVFDRSLPCAMP